MRSDRPTQEIDSTGRRPIPSDVVPVGRQALMNVPMAPANSRLRVPHSTVMNAGLDAGQYRTIQEMPIQLTPEIYPWLMTSDVMHFEETVERVILNACLEVAVFNPINVLAALDHQVSTLINEWLTMDRLEHFGRAGEIAHQVSASILAHSVIATTFQKMVDAGRPDWEVAQNVE